MNVVEIFKDDLASQIGEAASEILMRLTPIVIPDAAQAPRPSSSMMSALTALGLGSTRIQAVIKQSATSGHGLSVAFPPDIARQLQTGTLHLMHTSKGIAPIAVDGAGQIVSHASVIGTAAVGGAATAATGATAAALAAAALPVVIAGAAAYAGQQQLMKSLDEIKGIAQRIEARLEDGDSGVCDAAERFLSLAQDSLFDGGLTPYLVLELAAQRTAMEALYAARQQWVSRFKLRLESEQIKLELKQGRGQPWVSTVSRTAASGELEKELVLFIRSLIGRTKLGVLAASVLAEEGRGATAMKLMRNMESELRSQFFDLHNRLSPLALIAPDVPLKERVPGFTNKTENAYETVKALVLHMNASVLPGIPDPDDEREILTTLPVATVAELARAFDEAHRAAA